jgi:hypothetical protein
VTLTRSTAARCSLLRSFVSSAPMRTSSDARRSSASKYLLASASAARLAAATRAAGSLLAGAPLAPVGVATLTSATTTAAHDARTDRRARACLLDGGWASPARAARPGDG